MRIEWSEPAKAALEAYLDYLQGQRPSSSARAAAAIQTAIGRLANHPMIGRASRWEGLRELSLTDWKKIAVYRVMAAAVVIVAFYDARQDLSSLDPRED